MALAIVTKKVVNSIYPVLTTRFVEYNAALFTSECKLSYLIHKTYQWTVRKYSQNKVTKAGNQDIHFDSQFNDHQSACVNKTTKEVLRAFIVYKLCSINFLVNNNEKIIKICQKIMGKTVFYWLMKNSMYGHFVAGENEELITPILNRLQHYGVKPILDYAVEEDISHEEAEKLELAATSSTKKDKSSEANEVGGEMPQYQCNKRFADRRYKVSSARTYFYMNEESCEKNVKNFQKALLTVATKTRCSGIVAVKMTALGRPQLLLQLSEVIMRARKFVNDLAGNQGNVLGLHLTAETLEQKLKKNGITDTTKFLQNVVTDKEGIIHLFPWSGILNENLEINELFRVPSRKEGRMIRLLSELTEQEEVMFHNMIRRLNVLVQTSKELNVNLMVDAEQTYFQPAIARITLEMMNKHNTLSAVVHNTYQCYLKNALNELHCDLEQAKRQNFYFGTKLVRGAYMFQERERAAEMNYPDPINPTFEATTDMYHHTLTHCLKCIKEFKEKGLHKRMAVMVASHNEETTMFAIQKIKELGLSPSDGEVSFGQLYGMRDFITFPLGQAGYLVYKYVPYGPIEDVMPYLSRRAVENKSILTDLNKEKKILKKELLRRLKTGNLFYKPGKGNGVVC